MDGSGRSGLYRVFPAHAGMIRYTDRNNGFNVRVPRPRGDDPQGFPAMIGLEECSPPTRG